MTDRGGVSIRQLATGVPGLDDVLGGGLPELSFNLIVGGPGSGKTTLVHQIMFANATPERPGLYFTIVGEPPLKMLRYQQQYSFFDPAKVNGVIRFVSLSGELGQGLGPVLERIVHQVDAVSARFVVVDSFRSVMRLQGGGGGRADLEMQDFTQQLALHLTAWEATTFLVGEFAHPDSQTHPVFTVADSLISLSQKTERNSVVRKLQVVKIRGQNDLPGLHTFRITRDGLKVFPRLPKPEEEQQARRSLPPGGTVATERLSTGVSGLDEMLHGGVPRGYSVMVAGPSGSGKTVLCGQFIVEGVRRGEPGVIALFEKRPTGYLQTTTLGRELEGLIRDGKVGIVYLRPLDLSVDEALCELQEAVARIGAKRVAIDSLSGFEMAVSPGFREDFRESLYRLVGVLTGLGVTVMMTLEIEDAYTELRLGPRENAFLTDAIILQRYVELEGELRRVMMVVKVRASDHSKDLRLYEVHSQGLTVGDAVRLYHHGLLTADPETAEERRPAGASRPRREREA
jgi:circadian clock protein KaiC